MQTTALERAHKSAAAGRAGEWEAECFLKAKGYEILARNWRNPSDRRQEIDLVCRDGELLVIVEVKARKAGARVRGLLALNGAKARALRGATRAFLRLLPAGYKPRGTRFDIVEVTHGGDAGPEGPVIHAENCPLFDGLGW